VKLTEKAADFQNLKFQDLRQKLETADDHGHGTSAGPSNQF